MNYEAFFQSRLSHYRARYGAKGEELAQLNAEADTTAKYRKTAKYAERKKKWDAFCGVGRNFVKSGLNGAVIFK